MNFHIINHHARLQVKAYLFLRDNIEPYIGCRMCPEDEHNICLSESSSDNEVSNPCVCFILFMATESIDDY